MVAYSSILMISYDGEAVNVPNYSNIFSTSSLIPIMIANMHSQVIAANTFSPTAITETRVAT